MLLLHPTTNQIIVLISIGKEYYIYFVISDYFLLKKDAQQLYSHQSL